MYTGVYLVGKKGNNAFSYERRNALGSEPKLFVAPVIEGGLEEVRVGSEVAFEDFDGEELKSCVGLENFVRTEIFGVPAVIFDNHNHAFYFWFEAAVKGLLERGITLVHVDQHKDMREPEVWFEGTTLEAAFAYTNNILNVGNYIKPAMKCGLIGDVLSVTSEEGMDRFDRTMISPACADNRRFILNLDMDFFAPEMSYIDFEKAKKFVRALAERARFITIATSPFFMEQETAIDSMRKLF
ncbi:MAG: UPF0489 family protein [Candidatus Gracilibacteria bacterium]|jgi:hypothetical protein